MSRRSWLQRVLMWVGGVLMVNTAVAQDRVHVSPGVDFQATIEKSAGPAEQFAGCGVLATGPQSCTLLRTDAGPSYAVENTGGFSLGDRVWVEGIINPQSQECFPAIIPAIENNTIAVCFEECGTLAPGPQGCAILRRDDDSFVFLENVGSEPFSARVWVQGCLNPQSTLCGPIVGPGVENNAIGQCFADCGTLVETPFGCAGIEADQGLLLIQNRGSFQAGDRVWVEGCFTFNSPICVTDAVPVVLNNRIFQCFEGCGRLVLGILCTQFIAEDGTAYALENYGELDFENDVWVRGCLNPRSDLCPPLEEFPGIESNTIGRCFRDCGLIQPGPQGCPRFVGSDGVARFIENFPVPLPNERIWVTGCLDPNSNLCLPFTAPGIEDNTFGACFDACGVFVDGPEGCNLFVADDGGNYCLENTRNIRPGSRIRVTGCRSDACICDCPLDIPVTCILDNVIVGPLGDMNCDGAVTVSDIAGFVRAVTNPAAYQQQFANCNIDHADINCDGVVTVGDIGPFVMLLANAP